MTSAEPVAIEGYASLFGLSDLAGDVVFAGAFQESLARKKTLPLLLDHDPRLVAGRWIEAAEDSRGLYVRGEIDAGARAASLAQRRLRAGVDGLSIGFVAKAQSKRPGGGRNLLQLELWEVSLVAFPMAPQARLARRRA